MTADSPAFRWRSIALPALLPTALFSIGEGAIIPIIPVVAAQLGADLAAAGLVAAMILVGNLLGDIPSGAIIAKVGERAAMIGASGLSVLGLLCAVLAPNIAVLAVGMLLVGIATAAFALARHAFMTSFVPLSHRARALSTLGGTFRFGYFLGPFLTAAVLQLTGAAQAAFWLHLGCCVAAAVVLLTLPDPESSFGRVRGPGRGLPPTASVPTAGSGSGAASAASPTGLFATLRARRRVLLTLGLGAAIMASLRASRNVILPLWAVSIGLQETSTALIIGVAGAVDVLLFYAGGWIMDRFGRLWTAVPSLVGLSLAHLVLSLTHDLSANVSWFIGVALLLSVANGIGAGILMTLGADLADRRNPAPFLGAWRFQTDAGGAVVPLLIAGVTAAASLSVAAAVVGGIGLIGAVVLRVFVPRYSTRP